MTQEEQQALNLSLWKEWTHKSSAVCCCKFCSTVMDGATADQFLRYVQGFPVSAEITSLIERIVDGSYVPPGLDCTLQGIPQKHHLMYKIEPIEHPSGLARYEFLVEYDRYEPHVGIYFGCKCITLNDADHREMIEKYMHEWNEIRHHICTVLNNSFPTKEFRHRFRVTNNGENRTFWPSWIGLYDDEDMEFALTVLRIFRKAYEQYFAGTLKECRRLKPIAYRHVETAFTETAFNNLTEVVGKAYGWDNAAKAIELFTRFILNASADGVFAQDPSYDYAWRYVGKPEIRLIGSKIEFSTLIHLLTQEIGVRLGIKNPKEKVKTPWEHVYKVFLDAHGVAFKSGTRTQWQNALSDTERVCLDLIKVCLEGV